MTSTIEHDLPTRGSDYARLSHQVRSAGLLDRRRLSYLVRTLLTLGLLAAAWWVVFYLGNSWAQLAPAAVLGVVFTQIGFLAHDAGHQQILATRQRNNAIGLILGDLLIGLSFGWWIGKHNRHHANPNKAGSDPDIGDGVLAFTTEQVASRTGRVGRAVVRRQAWLFFPMLTLEGLNLHAASVMFLATGRSNRKGRRAIEIALLSAHLLAYVGTLAVVMSPVKALVFAAVHQGVWGFYMGCSFAPNHKGMPIIGAEEDLDFLRRQVLTSRNVRGGWFTDALLGGLNYQVEHHLFPNLPRGSLRAAQSLVKAHCSHLGVPYCETSMFGSYRAALTYLNQVGTPLRDKPA
ncbi:MAG: fatty acid desaturase [Pseudonocardiales bacterium]|nr:fatty acid desaturase [Pseudonocardiales bacterium]